MHVAVDTEAAEDTQVSAAEDARGSAAAPVRAELVAAIVEPGLADLAAAMARGLTRPEFQLGATAAIAALANGTTRRKARVEARFIVPARDRKVGPRPGSLLGRQGILVATMSREINPALGLLVSRACSPVVTPRQVAIFASSAPERLQNVRPGPAAVGHGRIWPTGRDSILKQQKDCVTGEAKRPDGTTQSITTRNTGVIVTTTTMTGGIIIATLSFLLAGVIGDGMTAGGTRPGATIRIIPIMTTMVRSMAMMVSNPTR